VISLSPRSTTFPNTWMARPFQELELDATPAVIVETLVDTILG
jgi:hypothetical protein